MTTVRAPGKAPKLNGKQEGFLVALACSEPPAGRTRWTMQLLANRLIELKVVDSIVDETVRRVLKKRRQAVAEKAMVHPDGKLGLRPPAGLTYYQFLIRRLGLKLL